MKICLPMQKKKNGLNKTDSKLYMIKQFGFWYQNSKHKKDKKFWFTVIGWGTDFWIDCGIQYFCVHLIFPNQRFKTIRESYFAFWSIFLVCFFYLHAPCSREFFLWSENKLYAKITCPTVFWSANDSVRKWSFHFTVGWSLYLKPYIFSLVAVFSKLFAFSIIFGK